MTQGARGSTALTATEEVSVGAPIIETVDTIGAGDTAMGAVLAWLHAGDRLRDRLDRPLGADALRLLLTHMCTAAALACTRPGAQPPTLDELRAFNIR